MKNNHLVNSVHDYNISYERGSAVVIAQVKWRI